MYGYAISLTKFLLFGLNYFLVNQRLMITTATPQPINWISQTKESKYLIVFLHGVNQHEKSWRHLINIHTNNIKFDVESHLPIDIYAPYFQHNHNGTVENYAKDMLVEVQNWIQTHPNSKILLVGFSNGGKVAMYLDSQINLNVKLKIITVGSPIYGTGWLNVYQLG